MRDSPHDIAWDDLRFVLAVADGDGLTGAAARLGINHSTAFRRLGALERTLGTVLFERHRTGYAATPAGEEMVALARRLDADVTAFARRLAGGEIMPAGEIRVATNDATLVALLTPLIPSFRVACPEIRIEVVVGNSALNLSRRDADVAVRATDAPPDTLVGRRIATIAWALYGRSGRDKGMGDPERWAESDWVGLGDALSGAKAARFVESRVAADRIVFRVDSVLALVAAVEAGIGIGYLPCFAADARPGLVRLAPPEPDLATGLWLLTHPDLRQAPRVRAFLDFMGAEMAKRRGEIEGTA